MSVRTGKRVGAAFVAGVLVAVAFAVTLVVGQPKAANAAPAGQSEFVAFGNIGQGRWIVMDADGGNQRAVYPTIGRKVGVFRYSPDGRTVAMLAEGELWAMSADTSNAHKLADNAWDSRIAWLPNSSGIVYGANGVIQVVSATGGSPPVAVFSDKGCVDSNPQVTRGGYIFFRRQCVGGGAPTLAVYRPGDASPSDVSRHSDAIVSPDGSRILWWDASLNVASVGIVGDDTYQVITPRTSAAVDFDSAGDIVIAETVMSNKGSRSTFTYYDYRLSKIADYPSAPVRLVSTGELGPNAPSVNIVQWVNGASGASARPIAERVGGVDRVDTAVKSSQWSYAGLGQPGRHAATAVLARADTFPDALTGTALAVQSGGPLLLTSTGGLDPAAGAELRRILAPGSSVYLLGGTAALAPAVADAVQRLGFAPVRLGGSDRYATAAIVATAISGTAPKAVLLATGTAFPDALTAGVAAGQERYSVRGAGVMAGGVVLLTDGATMPSATRAYLDALRSRAQSTSVYAVGGPAASALDAAFPNWPDAVRLVGADRFETAAKVAASALFGNGTPGRYQVAGIATGLNFPDAMSGGALIGAQGGPLFLADAAGLTPGELAVLKAGQPADIVVMGGPAAVTPGVLSGTADAVFGPHAWDTFTNRVAPPLR